MGRPETALKQCHQSLVVAEASGGAYDLVVGHGNACYLHQLRQDRDGVAGCARRVIEIASEKGYPHWHSLGSMFEAWVTGADGDLAGAIASFEKALAEHRATGEVIEVCYYLGVLAELLGRAGRFEDGLARIAEALELVERTGERWYEAELHRSRAELLRLAGKPDESAVEAAFTRAIDLARSQQAWLWELRAGTGLARLRADQARAKEACEILTPLCGAFGTPDFDEQSADRRAADDLFGRIKQAAESR
jgi:predicted ATPase